MIFPFRIRRAIPHGGNQQCRNPRCGDRLGVFAGRWELCPSCRLAYQRGALVAGVAGALITWLLKVIAS